MILFGSSLSPFVRKVLAYAAERGIELELQPTGFPSLSPDFVAASPLRKMPALKDDDFSLADSSAIIHYLEAKCPGRPLIPAEPRARGRAIWFEEYSDTMIAPCVYKTFFNRIVAPRFMGKPGDEEAACACEREEVPRILDYLEANVPEPGSFLVGNEVTLADIAIASPFVNFRHTNTPVDEERYPRTRAYIDSILARASFAPWVERETEFLARQAA